MRRFDLRTAQAARGNTIRDINRQIVLNYVREREPISRAEIARETELQRSTVSAIVEDLTSEGLVEEVGAGESTGGRRPTLLRLRTAEAIAIGVAITPTRITIATSDLAGRVIDQEEFLTNSDTHKTINRVIAVIQKLSRVHGGFIEAVGVTLPGLVEPTTGNALYVPYFKKCLSAPNRRKRRSLSAVTPAGTESTPSWIQSSTSRFRIHPNLCSQTNSRFVHFVIN